MTKSTISLYKGYVIPGTSLPIDNRIAVSTLQANLMFYGYILTEEAALALAKTDLAEITQLHNELLSYLQEKMGGKFTYKPLYADFPNHLMSSTDNERFIVQLQHYLTNGKWNEEIHRFEKEIKFESVAYTALKLGTEEDFDNIFTSLVSINTALTPTDLKIVKWFVESKRDLKFPNQIPFKENLCTLAAMGIPGLPVKTVTDVLRIAVHLSGGDISLPVVPKATKKEKVKSGRKFVIQTINNPERAKFKFKSFTRAERRYIIGLLENTNLDVRELKLKDERWVKLAHGLHIGEYKNQFPKSYEAIQKIRNEKVVSWYGQVDAAFKKNYISGLEMLSQRPGEFIRRMDVLVRKAGSKQIVDVMLTFRKIVSKTSNKVLFECFEHFLKRTEPVKNRSIFIKGARKKTELPDLPAINKKTVDTIIEVIFEGLTEKFKDLPPLGNCWIDEELKLIPLPTNMRTLSEGLRPIIRGQRVPFEKKDTKVVRTFVHWFNDGKRPGDCDIDLSCVLVSKDFKKTEFIGWNGERNRQYCLYSGDITSQRGACAEYVDIDVKACLDKGYKYAVIDIRDYKQGEGGISTYKDCVFGLDYRTFPEANPYWHPSTIANTMKISSPTIGVIVGAVDLETNEYFLIDMDNGANTGKSSITEIVKCLQQSAEIPKFSVYDLVRMHVIARGKEVDLDKNIDTYFKAEDYQFSYEKTAQLMGV